MGMCLFTSSQSKGFKKDKQCRRACKEREQKRRDIEDIRQLSQSMGELFPEYYGRGE
jgi:hypothetical protein